MYAAGLRRADPPTKESYRLCLDQGNVKVAKVYKGCGVMDGWNRNICPLYNEIAANMRENMVTQRSEVAMHMVVACSSAAR